MSNFLEPDNSLLENKLRIVKVNWNELQKYAHNINNN